MIDVKSKSKINIHWKVSPYDYSKEKADSLIAKTSRKYGIPKDKIKVIPEFVLVKSSDDGIYSTSDIIQNIQDPHFQQKLFKEYLSINNIKDYDFDVIKQIDSEINGYIDYQVYDKYRRYSIKWIRWSNFLSYGADNYFDFTTISGLTSLSGDNQAGKTTLSIDLIHFLLFGKTNKVSTQDKIFNKHLPSETNVVVEGCISIDGTDYVIKRTLSRPALSKRTSKSKTTNKVEYYKVVGDALEELEDCVDNQQEENSIQTNKAIKEAIGNESDFDLIMSVTESTLDDLVNKKESERGRLLSRWIGLLPIEEKNAIAREKFNSSIKPNLFGNHFNEDTLKQEIKAFKINIESLEKDNELYAKSNNDLKKELDELDRRKGTLMSLKRNVDDTLLKVDISTLDRKISDNISEGKNKKNEIDAISNEINGIGNIEFSIEEFDKVHTEYNEKSSKRAVIGERYKSAVKRYDELKSSSVCPTCGREMVGFDKKKLEALAEEIKMIEEEGKKNTYELNDVSKRLELVKKKRELWNRKSQLSIKKSALEVNVERLRNEYKDNVSLKREYEKNSEAINENNKIDIEVRNVDVFINDKRKSIENNSLCIARNESEIKNGMEQIKQRDEVIRKLKEEEKIVRNWKIYLDLVGKDGISKMVLRKTLPIINARLSDLLHDVCDFDVEVVINDKNDIMFYLIKDGIYSDLSSGSGFELTASGIALRAVLSELSTIPKMNALTFDEIMGRVSSDNYDNMKSLIEKISRSFDCIFLISHNPQIRDWCSNHISVKKENNISKIVLE